MVPVLDQNNKPIFPCKERRAQALMKRGEAVAYWQKGIFCIKLIRKETDKREEYPAIALGIDPGSKREGYTAATAKGVVLNITTNTPYWVKEHVDMRRILRNNKRQRNTPYRTQRSNRATLRKSRIPPSTKARWDAKLRITKQLLKIIPITHVNVEDIVAISKKGEAAWNKSFSPIEVGKNWFYKQLQYLGITFVKTQGINTYTHRLARGFTKGKAKLDYTWDAHNSDSHSLAEIVLEANVSPYLGVWKLEFIRFYRRQLHVQNPTKNGYRKSFGGTISLGISKGSILRYVGRNAALSGKLCYLGGTSNGKISVHSIISGNRISKRVNVQDNDILCTSRCRVQLLPYQKSWTSLREFV